MAPKASRRLKRRILLCGFTQEGGIHVDYKKAYFELYGELADLIERMQEIQRKYEERYISEADEPEEK